MLTLDKKRFNEATKNNQNMGEEKKVKIQQAVEELKTAIDAFHLGANVTVAEKRQKENQQNQQPCNYAQLNLKLKLEQEILEISKGILQLDEEVFNTVYYDLLVVVCHKAKSYIQQGKLKEALEMLQTKGRQHLQELQGLISTMLQKEIYAIVDEANKLDEAWYYTELYQSLEEAYQKAERLSEAGDKVAALRVLRNEARLYLKQINDWKMQQEQNVLKNDELREDELSSWSTKTASADEELDEKFSVAPEVNHSEKAATVDQTTAASETTLQSVAISEDESLIKLQDECFSLAADISEYRQMHSGILNDYKDDIDSKLAAITEDDYHQTKKELLALYQELEELVINPKKNQIAPKEKRAASTSAKEPNPNDKKPQTQKRRNKNKSQKSTTHHKGPLSLRKGGSVVGNRSSMFGRIANDFRQNKVPLLFLAMPLCTTLVFLAFVYYVCNFSGEDAQSTNSGENHIIKFTM